MGRNDDLGGHLHPSLSVVALLKTAGGRHNPGIFVGQIDLVLGRGTGNRRLGLLPARFFAGFLLFAGSFSHFLPIGGLPPGMAFAGTLLDLGFGLADRL
jgi:hypothetical protein